jgi:Domain of unknown function (DUF6458)
MGFMIGLIVTVVGFILALAVHPTNPGSVNVNTVGWIMVVVGLIAFFADLVFWSSWGPGYLRRTTYVDEGPGYAPGYGRSRWGYGGRRRVIEEEQDDPRGPGY